MPRAIATAAGSACAQWGSARPSRCVGAQASVRIEHTCIGDAKSLVCWSGRKGRR
jgi:hypothetical protein